MGKTEERLDNEECIRRLKRWFILGAGVAETLWPAGERRTYHVRKYGGYRLGELATDCEDCPLHGVGDDELDQLCRAVTPEPYAAVAPGLAGH